MRKHGNNAAVVQQELEQEKGIKIGLRAVERAVQLYRILARTKARATTRFETWPGEQAPINFGERFVVIGGQWMKVYFFVLILGHVLRW